MYDGAADVTEVRMRNRGASTVGLVLTAAVLAAVGWGIWWGTAMLKSRQDARPASKGVDPNPGGAAPEVIIESPARESSGPASIFEQSDAPGGRPTPRANKPPPTVTPATPAPQPKPAVKPAAPTTPRRSLAEVRADPKNKAAYDALRQAEAKMNEARDSNSLQERTDAAQALVKAKQAVKAIEAEAGGQ